VPVSGKVVKAMLGVRPEDCAVTAPAKGQIKGAIYATELIGDHTLVTVKTDGDMLTVKAAKDFAAKPGDKAGVTLARDRLFVFDATSGARIR
jgi:multiple sugar transport system ATP-binding protein